MHPSISANFQVLTFLNLPILISYFWAFLWNNLQINIYQIPFHFSFSKALQKCFPSSSIPPSSSVITNRLPQVSAECGSPAFHQHRKCECSPRRGTELSLVLWPGSSGGKPGTSVRLTRLLTTTITSTTTTTKPSNLLLNFVLNAKIKFKEERREEQTIKGYSRLEHGDVARRMA